MGDSSAPSTNTQIKMKALLAVFLFVGVALAQKKCSQKQEVHLPMAVEVEGATENLGLYLIPTGDGHTFPEISPTATLVMNAMPHFALTLPPVHRTVDLMVLMKLTGRELMVLHLMEMLSPSNSSLKDHTQEM